MKKNRKELNLGLFTKIFKCYISKARVESEFLNIKSKRITRKILEEVRTRVMTNVAVVEKDKIQAIGMLENENAGIKKKSEELQSQFYWIRFLEILKSQLPKKILFGVPNEKQKIDVKMILDNYFKQNIAIKNSVSLEDVDYVLAVGNKKSFSSSQDRKLEISEIFSHYDKIEEIFALFLNFSTKPEGKQVTFNPYPSHTLLNRACKFYLVINPQKSVFEEGLSQLIFYSTKQSAFLEFIKKYDLMNIDEDVNFKGCSTEINDFKVFGASLTVFIQKNSFQFQAATVNELLSLPNSPVKTPSSGPGFLFIITQESFYFSRKNPKISIRTLTENEINELFSIYLYRKVNQSIPKDCFPDMGKSDLYHKYVVIRDSVLMSSGMFSKHWLIQLKFSDLKKSSSEYALSRMCKWEGCMSPLVSETNLTKMVTEFNFSTYKFTNSNKKSLNPVKKARTASEAIIVTDLCIFHNNIRNIMRNKGVVVKNFVYDNSAEL